MAREPRRGRPLELEGFRDDVVAGLSAPQKFLPPKYFYDAAGSALFERICRLPEYYLTRAELALTRAHVGSIARFAGRGSRLVEYGSGESLKMDCIEINRLENAADELVRKYVTRLFEEETDAITIPAAATYRGTLNRSSLSTPASTASPNSTPRNAVSTSGLATQSTCSSRYMPMMSAETRSTSWLRHPIARRLRSTLGKTCVSLVGR